MSWRNEFEASDVRIRFDTLLRTLIDGNRKPKISPFYGAVPDRFLSGTSENGIHPVSQEFDNVETSVVTDLGNILAVTMTMF